MNNATSIAIPQARPDDGPSDPIAAVTHLNPGPYYARLAAREGVWRQDALGLHVASSPSAVQAVLSHPALNVRPPDEPVPRILENTPAAELFGRLVRMNEGSRHQPVKRILARALDALASEAVALACRKQACIAADRLRLFDEPWQLDRWISALPVSTMASLVGFAQQDIPLVAEQVGQYVAALSPASTAQTVAQAGGAAQSLLALAGGVQDAPPVGSIAAHVNQAAASEAGAQALQVTANLVGLLSQAFEAGAGLLGNTLRACAHQLLPGLRTGLDWATVRQRVVQVSRDDPAIHNTRRHVHEDCELEGALLRRGDTVLVVLASAIQGFGRGHHACPGVRLATDITAHAVLWLLQSGWRLDRLPRVPAYRPLPNARVPVFFPTHQELP
jgi:cytochrome P450